MRSHRIQVGASLRIYGPSAACLILIFRERTALSSLPFLPLTTPSFHLFNLTLPTMADILTQLQTCLDQVIPILPGGHRVD